ncbi:MAG: methyltransferase domain-containing protein [Alphaproteobacteria bacterium]|nr:methyltransferase domain-containing protein [Alphaproteobacteria bacterium]
MRMILLGGVAALALAACGGASENEPAATPSEDVAVEAADDGDAEAPAAEPSGPTTAMAAHAGDMDAVLADPARAEDAVRDAYRHPKETLAFFGIEPGMTVIDTLPGGGWYTKILMSYLGADGTVIGADYSREMWPLFGGFANEEFLERKKTWPATWSDQAASWVNGGADVAAFQFDELPEEMAGTADAILFIRSLHHLNRFEEEGDFLTKALAETMAVLKPGGIVGVVQHRGPEGNDDVWAEGDQGYLKQSQVIAAFEGAGFELVDSSEVNANPADVPTNDDMVWRLPPTLGTSADNAELRASMEAIGESDRMTLKFRKPE